MNLENTLKQPKYFISDPWTKTLEWSWKNSTIYIKNIQLVN